jgi:hypothetical protein
MAMVSNKFLAALSAKLGFNKHIRVGGSLVEYQNREYVAEIREAEAESDGARDYWMATKTPPKACLASNFIVAPPNRFLEVSFGRSRSLLRCNICRLQVQFQGNRAVL